MNYDEKVAAQLAALAALKAGDQVIVRSNTSTAIGTVERVTPTRRIKVDNDYYDRTGLLIGDERWHGRYITPATNEEVAKIKREAVISRAKRYISDNVKNPALSDDLLIETAARMKREIETAGNDATRSD